MTFRSPLGAAVGLGTAVVALSRSRRRSVGGGVGRTGADPALVTQLKRSASGSVTISEKRATKQVGFVRAGLNGDLLPSSSAPPLGKAKEFLEQFGGLLGVNDPSSELVSAGSSTDAYGVTHLAYRQVYQGLPVFGAVLKAHVDAAGDLTAVNGAFVPAIDIGTSPRLSPGQAGKRAIAAVVGDPPEGAQGITAAELRATAKLVVYQTGLVRGVAGTAQLAYQVEVTNGGSVRDMVFVHANAGKVINRYSLMDGALHRIVYQQTLANKIWEEGDAFPGALTPDQQNIVTFTGETYWLYSNAFGRDSYDGAGAPMRAVTIAGIFDCPNAFWDGQATRFCNGLASDDVVAHEWTHAVTEHTSGLIYQWQPGALNEAYSDVFGETIDLINGEQTDSPGGNRTVGKCSGFTIAILPQLLLNSPAEISGECQSARATFGPQVSQAGITADVAQAFDGTGPTDTSTTNGCTALTNPADVAGKIATIDSGTCAFVVKVKNAQDAGAVAVIVANTATGVFGTMAGNDPSITIPSVLTTYDNGNLIKSHLPGVNATIRAAAREASYRWLIGEDAAALGVLRDMWNPTCLSAPGKVPDAEYACDSGDSGGVHTNSGVVNHEFALLVDGGFYNGVTVNAIGLTKAVHLFFRAQSVYQTPTTDFEDHANAMAQSCQDLIGQNLPGLGLTSTPPGSSGQSLKAADCNAVQTAALAVELRTPPTQCNFGAPILAKDTPPLCPGQKNPSVIYAESFDGGLGAWTVSNQGLTSDWPGKDWATTSALPDGRAGTAAYAENFPNPCDTGDDTSGVMTLTSPALSIPATNTLSPRLVIDHYLASEQDFDGGNIKVSINGGTYQLVPASAFLFNPYNDTLVTAGNSDPLAGQQAFTGVNDGEVGGNWGTSQIDLTKLGAKPGDVIQVRFDFGQDICLGVSGWYLDSVRLEACNAKKAPSQAVVGKEEPRA